MQLFKFHVTRAKVRGLNKKQYLSKKKDDKR